MQSRACYVGTRLDGKKAVHGALCDCVYEEDRLVIRELGSECNDFYVQPSTLKVK